MPLSFLNGAAPLESSLDASYKAWKAAEHNLVVSLVKVQADCRHPQVLHELDGMFEHRRTCVVCGLTEKGSVYSRLSSWSREVHPCGSALRDAPGRLIIGVTGAQAASSRLHFPRIPENPGKDQKPGANSSSNMNPG